MTELHVSSLPILNMLQEACERLVMVNHILAASERHAPDRSKLLQTAEQAKEMVDHLRNVIANNNVDV